MEEVLKPLKSTLALTGNSSNYISKIRRRAITNNICQSRPKLAKFLSQICKDELGDAGSGPQARKKIIERANTIEAFNKAMSKVDSGLFSSKPNTSGSLFYPRARLSSMGASRAKCSARTPVPRVATSKATKEPVAHKQGTKSTIPVQPVEVPVSLVGALSLHLSKWQELTDNPWVLQSIQGYHLEFVSLPPDIPPRPPPPRCQPNRSDRDDKQPEGDVQPNFCGPQERRGVANNQLEKAELLPQRHPLQDGECQQPERYSTGRDWMGKIDLKDAYLTVPIYKKHRQFLRFKWRGQRYLFKSLPFGLATAPRTFTKLLCPWATKMCLINSQSMTICQKRKNKEDPERIPKNRQLRDSWHTSLVFCHPPYLRFCQHRCTIVPFSAFVFKPSNGLKGTTSFQSTSALEH